MSLITVARYAATSTFKGATSANNYSTTAQQVYFPVERKASPLITPGNSGSGVNQVSQFTLKAPGSWLITAGMHMDAQTGALMICLNNISTGTMIRSGDNYYASCAIIREFNYNSVIMVSIKMASANGLMLQGQDDPNFISFAFLGAV